VVVVFGFSALEVETRVIASVLSRATEHAGPIRVIAFGRGAKTAETHLQLMLEGFPVELTAFGIVESQQGSRLLAEADVQVFVRCGLSSRCGSGIAGIMNGVPIVGFSDGETAFPITEAGVRLVPMGDTEGLLRELVSVLREATLREQLRRRNLEAARRYFAWDRIGETYLSALNTV